MIAHFNGSVLMPEADYQQLLQRNRQLREFALALRDRLDDERVLLVNALHQLAVERNAKDAQTFMRVWVNGERRRIAV